MLMRSELRNIILVETKLLLESKKQKQATKVLQKILKQGIDKLNNQDIPGLKALKSGVKVKINKIVDGANIFKKIKTAFDQIKKELKGEFNFESAKKIILKVVGMSIDKVLSIIAFGTGPVGILSRWVLKYFTGKGKELLEKQINKFIALAHFKDKNPTLHAFLQASPVKFKPEKEVDASKYKFDPRQEIEKQDKEIERSRKLMGLKELRLSEMQLRKIILESIYSG